VFGETMCDFWSSVVLMTGHYKGNPPNMRLDMVPPEHSKRWLAPCRKTAREICPHIAELAPLRISRAVFSWACSSTHPISQKRPPEASPMISALPNPCRKGVQNEH